MSAVVLDLPAIVTRVFTGNPATIADPFPLYRALQVAGPVHWLDGDPGDGPWHNAWHVLGYAETAAALKDRRLGAHRMPEPPSANDPITAEEEDAATLRRILGLTLLYLEPPDHTRLRLLTARTFTRRIGDGLRPAVQSIVSALLDRVQTKGAFDAVAELATPLPIAVVAELLGIPDADRVQFAQRTGGIMTMGPDPRAMANLEALLRYFGELAARRRHDPGDDLITDLVHAQNEDDALTEDELIAQCVTVVVAGTETTTAALATGILTLLRRPAVWAAVTEDNLGSTVDELLRFDGPTRLLPREAMEDTELGGDQIRAGQRLWLWVAAANRDPRRFAHPDQLDIERGDNRHLAFGSGMHACIGAALARLEMQIALAALRQRFPALRLTADNVVWQPNPAIRSPEQLMLATR